MRLRSYDLRSEYGRIGIVLLIVHGVAHGLLHEVRAVLLLHSRGYDTPHRREGLLGYHVLRLTMQGVRKLLLVNLVEGEFIKRIVVQPVHGVVPVAHFPELVSEGLFHLFGVLLHSFFGVDDFEVGFPSLE